MIGPVHNVGEGGRVTASVPMDTAELGRLHDRVRLQLEDDEDHLHRASRVRRGKSACELGAVRAGMIAEL